MELLVRSPLSPVLARHIEQLWYCEDPTSAGSEFVAPTGASQIVVPLVDDATPVIAGIFTGPQPIDATQKRRACGVVFRLGHTGAFVSAPLGALVDEAPMLDPDLWSGPTSMTDQLGEAATPELVFGTLERLLLAALNQDWQAEPTLLAGAQLLGSGAAVSAVVSELNVDRRRFGRAFTEVLGVGPKQFSNIRRFQYALRTVRRSGEAPLGVLAAELGYSDQAHMTREFRTYSGSTPAAVHGLETESPGHFAD